MRTGPFDPQKPWTKQIKVQSLEFRLGTVYNRATIQGLIYPYYEYYSTATGWGQHPKFRVTNPQP